MVLGQGKEEWVEGPYQDRKKIMKTLCKKAGSVISGSMLFATLEYPS
jgi:hypothetical protein